MAPSRPASATRARPTCSAPKTPVASALPVAAAAALPRCRFPPLTSSTTCSSTATCRRPRRYCPARYGSHGSGFARGARSLRKKKRSDWSASTSASVSLGMACSRARSVERSSFGLGQARRVAATTPLRLPPSMRAAAAAAAAAQRRLPQLRREPLAISGSISATRTETRRMSPFTSLSG